MTTDRVAVICATHPLPNPGMVSADFAFEALRRRCRLPGKFEYYRLYTPNERNVETAPKRRDRFHELSRSPIEYRSLRDEFLSARAADTIVYWGDFLHSRDFLVQTASVLTKIGAVPTYPDAIQTVLRTLFLAGESDETIHKAFLFGGSFLFNTAKDYEDVEYNSALASLLRGASGVWMREFYSVATAERLGCTHAELGVDCALLLHPEDLGFLSCNAVRVEPTAENLGGIFFGRNCGQARIEAEFAQAICEEMGVRGEWLPWFDDTLIGNRLATTRNCFPEIIEPMFLPSLTAGDLLRRLAGYRFIITDTYHLCVNAWSLGVPAVCVGESFPNTSFDVSSGWYGSWRDKRQCFYSMIDTPALFSTVEELSEPERFARRLHIVLESLRDRVLVSNIIDQIHSRALKAEHLFVEALRRRSKNPGGNGGGMVL